MTPLADSPAYRAGIMAGDEIVAVDGELTKDREVDDLVDSIMGKEGTTVILTIKRRGRVKPFDVPIVREEIRIRTVNGWSADKQGHWSFTIDPSGTVGYIRVSQFTAQTAEQITEALRELDKAGVKSVILDLRFDPGGLLRSAVEVCDQFLNHGEIVSTEGRQVPASENDATSGGAFTHGDLVILVNEDSASAAEIVSGSLQDLGRATIVGVKSYGKGSVQSVIDLKTNPRTKQTIAAIKLTTAHYRVGDSRRLIDKQLAKGSDNWGVQPNVNVYMTPHQTLHWRELQFQNDLLEEVKSDQHEADMGAQLDADLQLQTAIVLTKLLQVEHVVEPAASQPATATAAK